MDRIEIKRKFITHKKDLRINIAYRGGEIRFGTVDLRKDNSIVFVSSFLNDTDLYKTLDIVGTKTSKIKNDGDIHVSLHPIGQCTHIRKQKTKKDLLVKNIRWFPVINPFAFLKIVTPPLDKCNLTKKTSEIGLTIDDNYLDSLEFMIYVLPYLDRGIPIINDNEEPFLLGERKSHFRVALSIRKMNEKCNPAVSWKNGDWFIESK